MFYSPVYITENHIKKYQAIADNQLPQLWKFKDTPVYLKKQLVDLHSKSMWSQLCKFIFNIIERTVHPDSIPFKTVISRFNKNETTKLYGIWQTTPTNIQIVDDKIPVNQYNNYEMINDLVPDYCSYLNFKGINAVAKKNSIYYVDVMRGFEM